MIPVFLSPLKRNKNWKNTIPVYEEQDTVFYLILKNQKNV